MLSASHAEKKSFVSATRKLNSSDEMFANEKAFSPWGKKGKFCQHRKRPFSRKRPPRRSYKGPSKVMSKQAHFMQLLPATIHHASPPRYPSNSFASEATVLNETKAEDEKGFRVLARGSSPLPRSILFRSAVSSSLPSNSPCLLLCERN